jgi:4-amino-4-deoxy-L-arabinose transferase-like glycosyltransferase
MNSQRARSLIARVPRKYLEVGAATVIVLIALLLRTLDLSNLPAGFHGDEAVVGLEAQRILDEGYIGPYSPYAAGQPTGPIYLVAISVALFDNTFFAVRIVPALMGTLTVLALYIVARRSFGIPTALIAASILATMSWHLHFARIGFPLATWPLLAVLIAGSVAEAMRKSDWRWWAVSGALTGSGIYIYNAHPLYAAVVGLFIAGYLVLNRNASIRRDVTGAAIFGVAMLLVLIPMARFATAEDTYYWEHFDRDRLTETEEWRALDGTGEQARFLISEYRGTWNWLCCEPELDLVDGTGLTIITPPLMLWLAGAGMLIALGMYRRPLVYLGILVVLIMPLGPVLSVGGETRRTLVMAPFIAMFCALACIGAIDLAHRQGRRVAYAASAVVLTLTALVMYLNMDLYFREFAEPELQEEILGKPIADAAKFLDDLPDDHYVYFYSDIWSIDYATRLFLAPDVRGEDRSHFFGEFTFDIDPERGPPLFVFLGTYLDEIDTVREIYPGREITPDDFAVRPTFRVFEPVFGIGAHPELR